MSFSWTFDTPTGVYKNHDMSEQLRFAAIAETKFMQFVKPEAGYGRKKGESVTITRVSNLEVPNNGRISEQNKIPEYNLSISTKAITVSEWGAAVPYTSLSDDLGKFDVENMIQKKLKDQMALVLDNACAEAATGSDVKITATPTGAASISFGTNGAAPATATSNLLVYHVEEIRDYMFGTLKVPAYSNDEYICLLATKAKRGLVSDPNWEVWHKYTDPSAKYNGEIGKLENIRFIEVNNFGALSNGLGTGSVLGEAVFFGADFLSMAVAVDPELRAAIPGDFGRSKAVAWYGVMDFGVVWDTANAGEARGVHVTSL